MEDPSELLGEVDTSKLIWCNSRPQNLFSSPPLGCFQDRDSDGLLDHAYSVSATPSSTIFDLTPVVDQGRLAKPVPFRTGNNAERISLEIGYELCNDSVETPRFRSAIHDTVVSPVVTVRVCMLGKPDNAGNLLIDALLVNLTKDGRALKYEVLETRIADGDVYLEANGLPIQAVEGATTYGQRAVRKLVETLRQPILAASGPVRFASPGSFSEDKAVLSVPVVHGKTGKLANDVKERGLFASGVLPAGTPLYAISMSPGLSPLLSVNVWCAPRIDDADSRASRLRTVCLPRSGLGSLWIENKGDFLVQGMSGSTSSDAATLPEIDETPTDLKIPMTLALVFEELKQQTAVFSLVLQGNASERQILSRLEFPLEDDGSLTVKFGRMGMEIPARRDPEQPNALIIGAPVEPIDIQAGDTVY